MVTLNASSDIEDVKNRLGIGPEEELRTSNVRQNHLERYARIMTMNPRLRLFLHEDRTDIEMDGEVPVIRVTNREFNQTATNLERRVFDLVMQETLTDHEIGHDLYSDWPSIVKAKEELEEYIEKDPDGIWPNLNESDRSRLFQTYVQMFHTIWNALEDGCIERALWNEFYNREEFDIMHNNIIEDVTYGELDIVNRNGKEVEVEYFSMYSAIIAACMDLGYFDSGTLDKLFDETNKEFLFISSEDQETFENFLPTIEDTVKKLHKEGNAVKRNEMVLEFFKECMKIMEQAHFSGKQTKHMYGTSPIEDLPDDFHEGIGEASMDANMEGDGGESTPVSGNAGQRQQDALKKEIDQAIGERKIEELEKLIDTMGRLGGEGDNSMEIDLPDPEDGRQDIWERGVHIGRRILPILRDRLRVVERDRILRKKRRGTFDNRRMISAARGDIDIFRQNVEGTKKKYQCVLIVDKSGSMSGSVDDAELAVIGYTWALENLGIETMVIDIHNSRKRLLKPFGVNPTSEKGHLSSGAVGGGTPLASAVRLARHHVQRGGDARPFIVVITDGAASNMQSYQAELAACSFPVYGVYIRDDVDRTESYGQDTIVSLGESLDWFNRWELVGRNENVADALLRLSYSIVI